MARIAGIDLPNKAVKISLTYIYGIGRTSALEICEKDIAAKRLTVNERLQAGRHHVKADPARLQQVAWNLIKNAVKFTEPEGTITIATFNRQDDFVLEVTDNGKGFSPPELANPKSLGLLGMQERAAMIGGQLSFSAGPAGGARLTLRLPQNATDTNFWELP